MTGAEYMAFVGASVILAVTPGPDTFLTLRFAAHSVRSGFVYTAAVSLGVLAWAVLALTGVAALLQSFPEIRSGLTWIGGSYLVFLGVSALVQVYRARRRTAEAQALVSVRAGASARGASASGAPAPVGPELADMSGGPLPDGSSEPRFRVRSHAAVFRTGMISSLTNPKTGLFFLALLPPFLPASPSPVDHVILVATVVACMVVYGVGLSVVARRVGKLLTGGSGPLIVDAVAGSVLVVLGVSLIAL